MSLTVVWFIGSLVGGLVVREIGDECVARPKRPEPIGEAQLTRLKEVARASRSYVPTSQFLLAKSTEKSAVAAQAHQRVLHRALRPPLAAVRPSFVLRAFAALRDA